MDLGRTASRWSNNVTRILFPRPPPHPSHSLSLHFLAQSGSPSVEALINSRFTSSLELAIPVVNGFSIPKLPTEVLELSLLS